MGDETKEALLEVILKALKADADEVEAIELNIKWKPSKSKKEKTQQG